MAEPPTVDKPAPLTDAELAALQAVAKAGHYVKGGSCPPGSLPPCECGYSETVAPLLPRLLDELEQLRNRERPSSS